VRKAQKRDGRWKRGDGRVNYENGSASFNIAPVARGQAPRTLNIEQIFRGPKPDMEIVRERLKVADKLSQEM
jgi:hypothetical protein